MNFREGVVATELLSASSYKLNGSRKSGTLITFGKILESEIKLLIFETVQNGWSTRMS